MAESVESVNAAPDALLVEELDFVQGAQNWCATKSKLVRFSATWTVHNFSLHFERGASLESGVFTSGDLSDGTRWSLKLDMSRPNPAANPGEASPEDDTPEGIHVPPDDPGEQAPPGGHASPPVAPCPRPSSQNPDESLSLWLCLLSSRKPEVWVKYKFSIIDENSEECIAARPQSRRFTPGKRCGPTLRSMDPTRTGRFLSEILHDDQLTVSCEVFIMLETYNKTGAVNKLKVPNCSVSEDLGRLLETPRFSDVTLCVEGKEFQVHQNILSARSPVFSAMFGHEMLESRERRVEISDLSADVVADLLRYVYSGVAPNLDHMAPELLAGADKYELNRLKVLCEQHLAHEISAANVCQLLILADLHNATHLRGEAMEFLVSNASEVMLTPGFHSMEGSQPRLVAEAFRSLAAKHSNASSDGPASSLESAEAPDAKRIRLSV